MTTTLIIRDAINKDIDSIYEVVSLAFKKNKMYEMEKLSKLDWLKNLFKTMMM